MTKIIKLTDQMTNKIEDLVKKSLMRYYSAVTPEMLEEFKKLMFKEIEKIQDTKDNEDYNFELISGLIDRSSQVFAYYGQKKMDAGDMMQFIAHNKYYWAQSGELSKFEDAKTNPYYFQYPFSDSVVSELRGKFILQTEKSDNFKSLMDRIEAVISKYMNIDEWNILKKSINDAESRIRKEQFKFMFPLKGYDLGELKTMTAQEAETYGIKQFSKENTPEFMTTDSFEYDLRRDNHDMLSLKELVLILEGKKKTEPISIGPGFFAKYMPELIQNGFDGIVFKIKNNEVVSIKLSSFYGRSNDKNKIYFSPLKASILLAQEYAVEKDVLQLSPTSKKTTFKNINADFIKDDELYFVIVDGMVSSPEIGSWKIGDVNSYNTIGIEAGEVFLFEKRKTGLMQTRLYFMPYKPSLLHVFHQHGSLVFGHNDQSLHSCSDRPNSGSMTMLEEDDYKTFWANSLKDSNKKKEPYSPAMMAALIHHQPDEKDKKAIKFLYPENDKILKNIAYSFFEISYFTLHNEINMLVYKAAPYVKEDFHELLYKMNENYAPLTKRFLLSSYMKGQYITEEIQPAWYDSLASGREKGILLQAVGTFAKLEFVLEYMDKGYSAEEAVARYELESKNNQKDDE